KDRRIYVKGSPDKALAISAVAGAAHFTPLGGEAGPILGRGYWDSQCDIPDEQCNGNMCAAYSFAADAVEVEVDAETGKIEILTHSAAHDVGRALNPAICEGQVSGGLGQAIGYGLYEEMVYEPGTGRLLNSTYLDYKIPTALDVPDAKVKLWEELDTNPHNFLGVKGIGEASMNCEASAIASAVYEAVGVRIASLPVTAEKVYKALKEKGK
ncbi:MAG: molybdopterin-dependent oxidoreductase, partial [Chloroflexi bacterium]|nr:molybdopterin-dependent oxidoreductase [Chloroflexota bacterium]